MIVAILLVESRFGENIGKHRVVPTLASMAIMDAQDNLQNNFLVLREKDPELAFESVENRAKRRASWAYNELKCFLTILRDETIDPLEVKGSHAGALGMPQFIPSSDLDLCHPQGRFRDLAFEQGGGDPQHCKLSESQWVERGKCPRSRSEKSCGVITTVNPMSRPSSRWQRR